MKHLRKILFPFSALYYVPVVIRNKLFDWGIKPSHKYDFPIISVGNITVGGTGKTPLTEYIISLFIEKYTCTLLSRGYKRATKGVVIANSDSTASEIGDEPMQIKNKFSDLNVVVAEKRVLGIEAALKQNSKPDIIIMDDAYQHRHVKPGLSILVIDSNRPIWKDLMLPAGELREPSSGKRRADIILFSKCSKEITLKEKENFTCRIKPAANQHLFFSSVKYGLPTHLISGKTSNISIFDKYNCLALTGIANPTPFHEHLKEHAKIVMPLSFNDHHNFSKVDIEHITETYKKIQSPNKIIFTTEKDAVRLKGLEELSNEMKNNIWYIPIEIEILFNEQQQFNETLINYVEKTERNC